MSAEDLEKYETEMELKLYREYRDVVGLFKYVIETERRFYLTNDYEMQVHSVQGEVFFEVSMADAWVWDMYRPARFVKQVRVLTFKDVNIEELNKSELDLPRIRLQGLTCGRRPRICGRPPPHSTGERSFPQPPGCPPEIHIARLRLVPSQSVPEVVPNERARKALGRYGEDLAARRLREAGMAVLERNWRCADGRDRHRRARRRTRWSSARSRPAGAAGVRAPDGRRHARARRERLRAARRALARSGHGRTAAAAGCASTWSACCCRDRGAPVVEHARGVA